MKTLILCADDFGMNSGISEGILNLASHQRVSAVSCMTNMLDFNLYAKELRDFNVMKGLHFNLTEGFFLSNPRLRAFSLKTLLFKSHMNLINSNFIAQELNAQLEHYIHHMQAVPDFIDGHQHVHHFPVVRQVLLKMYHHRLRPHKTWIRSTTPSLHLPSYQLKAKLLGATGGNALSLLLKKELIPHNSYFSGIYNFNPKTNYRYLFRQWLNRAQDNTLIMCHPGQNTDFKDAIAATRPIELNYFLSNEFLEDCTEHGVTIELIK